MTQSNDEQRTVCNINNETITTHTDDIGLGMDISSDGKLIATPSKDMTIKVWKINE